MKKSDYVRMGLIFGMAAGWAARGAAQGPPPDTGRRAELIAKYDANGDGALSDEEIARSRRGNNSAGKKPGGRSFKPSDGVEIRHDAEMQELMERFDADGDGLLNYGEMAALRSHVRSAAARGGSEP